MIEFRGITGPGRYRTRSGLIEDVELSSPSSGEWRWRRRGVPAGHFSSWRDDGSFSAFGGEDKRDLIEGPLAAGTEIAGLRGYGIFREGYCTFVPPHELGALLAISEGEVVIDLSKVPSSAIVKPAPKRETRKVTLVMYRNGAVHQWSGPVPAQWNPPPDIIAIVERDIEFPHGEGLVRP